MHAVVFVKQVPQQNSVKITADKQIDTSGIEPIISLFDEYAIEEALLQVEKSGGKVTVVTIGGEEQIDALRKALAMSMLFLRQAVHRQRDRCVRSGYGTLPWIARVELCVQGL